VAVCVETHCKPEDYYCADKSEVRDMLPPGEQ